MTRPEDPVGDLPPIDELDELASALLDGTLGDDDLARATDPAVQTDLARRLARLERVQAILSEPVAPVDAEARDAVIAAALAAADDGSGRRVEGDELAVRRSLGTGRRAARLRVLGAAAAVLAVVALGAVVLDGATTDDADTATDTADSAEESVQESAEGGIEGSGGDDAASPEMGGAGSALLPVLGDLGDFPDADALLDAVGSEGQVHSTASDDGPDDEVARERACAGDTDLAGTLGVLVATATVDGDPVAVWTAADGGPVVVDLGSCAVLAGGGP